MNARIPMPDLLAQGLALQKASLPSLAYRVQDLAAEAITIDPSQDWERKRLNEILEEIYRLSTEELAAITAREEE